MINFQLMPINVYFSLAGTRNTEVGKNSPCFELDDTRTSPCWIGISSVLIS